jgi:uncharacterized protein (TIGR03382 family)
MRLRHLLPALALTTSSSAFAFSDFAREIPNGGRVSCAGCHERAGGGPPWNAFGDLLFTTNGGTADDRDSVDAFGDSFIWWNAAICNADSDGDGQTNGQELGDPECVWTGGAAARTTDISNPGSDASTSNDPDGGGGGEGEGEGEGEVEDEGGGGCQSTPIAAGVAGLLPLLALVRRRRR